MAYYPRSSWWARPPKNALGSWGGGQPSSWTLHYSDGDLAVDRDQAYYADVLRGVQNYHMDSSPENYSDIAYNFAADPIGNIYECRGWDHPSAAQFGAVGNPYSIALVYLGGPSTPLTEAAKAAIAGHIAQRPMQVFGHQNWGPTSCPGQYVMDWINAGIPGGTPGATGELTVSEANNIIGTLQTNLKEVEARLKADHNRVIGTLETDLKAIVARLEAKIDARP